MRKTTSAFLQGGRGGMSAGAWSAVVFVALLVGLSVRAEEPEVVVQVPPFEKGDNNFYKHTGTYLPLDLEWSCVDVVEGASAVFPHPVISARAVVATADGLQITEDQGQNWKALPAGGIDKLGLVQSVAFDAAWPEIFYVGSRTRGVWKTSDNGKTFSQIGSKASGMADDPVSRLVPYDGNRILLVLHGDEAPGISRTMDGGKTWDIIHQEFYVHHIFSGESSGQNLFLSAAPISDPYAACLYVAPSLMEPWQELGRDIQCTGFAAPRLRSGWVLVSTADRGILRVTRNGGTVRNIAPASVDEWFSIGSTWDATADTQVVYAFEPTKLGLVVIDPSPKLPDGGGASDSAYGTASRGLLTCPVVREGAHIRASANGMVYYACVNSMLYRAERRGGDTPFVSVDLSPAVCRYDSMEDAKSMSAIHEALSRFMNSPEHVGAAAAVLKTSVAENEKFLAGRLVTLTAVIANDQEGLPPRQVTVDLSRLGYALRTPLRSAGDGVYSVMFAVDPQRAWRNGNDWRTTKPMGLTVTAVSKSEGLSAGIGALSVVNSASRALFHTGDSPRSADTGNVKQFSYESKVFRKGRKVACTQITAPGPWKMTYSHGWAREALDTSGLQVFSFWIRTNRVSTEDLAIQLQDSPTFGLATTTKKLPLIAGGYVPGNKFTGEFQHIIIPVSDLIGDSETFVPSIVSQLFISGDAGTPIEYYLDQLVFYESAETAVSDEERQ